jgi:Zn-dependent membrane protease YugP
MSGIYFISILILGVSWYVSFTMQRRFKQYAQLPINLSGKQVAEKMLRDHGIYDVQVMSVPGALTDHYDPIKKTVNLSDWVYAQSNVAAAAVAAHECGHAVQHAAAYTWLNLRSKLVPVVQVSSSMVQWIILGGLLILMFTGGAIPWVLLLGIVLFAITTLFSFITLPVEFDASARALRWLESTSILHADEHDKAANALKWAASTYVVAALGSLVTLLYYISIFAGARRRD